MKDVIVGIIQIHLFLSHIYICKEYVSLHLVKNHAIRSTRKRKKKKEKEIPVDFLFYLENMICEHETFLQKISKLSIFFTN